MILRASSQETKQTWVRRLRQVIQDSYLSNHLAKTPSTTTSTTSISSVSTTSSKITTSTSLSKTGAVSVTASKHHQGVAAVPHPRSVVSATTSVIAATASAGFGRPQPGNHQQGEEPVVAASKSPLHSSGRYSSR